MPSQTMLVSVEKIHRVMVYAFGLILAGALGLFFTTILPNLEIETDLVALLPQSEERQQLRATEQKIIADSENQFVLVLGHRDNQILQAATDLTKEQLFSQNYILPDAFSNSGGVYGEVERLREHRFHLLNQAQRQYLANTDNNSVFQNALKKIYSLTGGFSVSQVSSDPLGLFDEWLLTLTNPNPNLQWDDGVVWIENGDSVGTNYALITAKFRASSLNLKVQENFKRTLDSIEAELDQFEDPPMLLRSGVIFHAMSAASAAQKEVTLISGGSVLAIISLVLLLFRSLKPLLLTVSAILCGSFLAFTCVHWFFGKIHFITLVFGASLIGVAVDYAFHYFTHADELGRNQSKFDVLQKLFPGLSLSLTTSLIGYGCLFFSTMPGLRQIALFSVVGLVGAWLFVVCLFPFIPNLVKPINNRYNRWAAWPALKINKIKSGFRSSLPLTIFGLGIALCVFLLRFDDEPRALYKPDESLLRQDLAVQQLLPDYSATQFIAVIGDTTEETLRREEELAQSLRNLVTNGAINDFLMTSQFVPSISSQEANYQLLADKVYGRANAAARVQQQIGIDDSVIEELQQAFTQAAANYLLPADLSDAGILERLWMGQNQNIVVAITLLSGIEDVAALQQLADESESFFFIDRVADIKNSLTHQRLQAERYLLAAYGALILLLLWRYRNWQALLILMIPACSSILLLSLLALNGTSVSLFHVFALFLVLGLGMDYGIFLKETGAANSASLLAIALSAFTTCMGFGLLSLSSTPMVSAFGLVMLIGGLSNALLAPLLMSFVQNGTIETDDAN